MNTNGHNLRGANWMTGVEPGVRQMKTALATTVFVTGMMSGAPLNAAGPIVPDGFELEKLYAPLPTGFVHQIEAVRNPAYGSGVMYAVADRGTFTIHGVDLAGRGSTLTTIGPFPSGAELLTLRFDASGSMGKRLYASVYHNGGDQPFNYRTDLVMIAADGAFSTVASFGTKTNPMAMHFDTARNSAQFPDGMYLLDADNAAGAAMYYLQAGGAPTLLASDVRPSGRTDLDPRGFELAPTGLYGQFAVVADSDDDDAVSAIYQWKGNLTVGELAAPVRIDSREFGDMAFSPGGVFGDRLYVTERLSKKVLSVSYRGQFTDFASGFDDVQSVSVGSGGDHMFVSDANGIYHIQEHVIPPPTVALGPHVVGPGVGADNATGSRVVAGQSATGSASNATMILHAGWIPTVFGAALAPMFGDYDGNRIIDLNDYQNLSDCLAGPENDAGDACARGDSNGDGDVDLRDAAEFMQALSE